VAIHAIASSAAAEVKDNSLPAQDAQAAVSASKSTGGRAEQVAQALVLAVLFAVPALICVRAACVIDLDIWWHLRTGEWMLLHHAVPHVDLYSAELAGRPWLAYSWLFELLTVKLFQWLGLAGIVAYSSAMVLAITVALFHMVRRLQGDFTLAVLLTFAAVYSMGRLYTPRPWLFTILFFILEMDILIEARKTGRVRELAWLPVIFALWANLHIQFVDGLFVLGLAWVEAVVALWWKGAETRLRSAWMGLALAASLLATLLNPYGWRIYQAAFDLATQGGALNKVTELQAMPFRGLPDFLILLLALGSAAALAWRRRFQPFETALLAFAAVLAFRSQRDVWVMATVGALILASSITSSEKKSIVRLPRLATALAVLVAGFAVLAGSRVMRGNNARLETQLAKNLPVSAVEAVRAKGYAGPLYNNYNWGGYLVWALRMPVSIDGRQNLYGDQRIDRSLATWNAEPDWASDAQLTSAGVVIGPVKAPLTQVLRLDPRCQLVYEDNLAAVFIARR
jgi:hypothetical protein